MTTTDITITLTASDDSEENQHRTYDATINNCNIETIVTRSATVMSTWIRNTISIANNSSNEVIGLSIKIRPRINPNERSPVAILVFCLDNRCLIYQILQCDDLDDDDHREDLKNFLLRFTFVGVDLKQKIEMDLPMDHNLTINNFINLIEMAKTMNNVELPNVRELANHYLNLDIFKLNWIENSFWDRELLSTEQVKCAVYDAYLSYKVGMVTDAHEYIVID